MDIRLVAGNAEYRIIRENSALLVKITNNCETFTVECGIYDPGYGYLEISGISKNNEACDCERLAKVINFDLQSVIQAITTGFIFQCNSDIYLLNSIRRVISNHHTDFKSPTVHINPRNKFVAVSKNMILNKHPLELIIFNMRKKILKIRETVRIIGVEAFASNFFLTYVVIPPSVKLIDEKAFFQCKNLRSVTFPGNSELQKLGSYAFSHTALVNFKVPSSVKEIEVGAFSTCKNLINVFISENSEIKKIKELAFFETDIRIIILPRNIEECSPIKLFGFHISNSSSKILTIKTEKVYILGIYDEDMKALDLSFLRNNNYNNICLKVPPSVQKIDSDTLNCQNIITTLNFAENSNLESINDGAFRCTNINEVYFPASLKIVEKLAFYAALSLKNISFSLGAKLSVIKEFAFSFTQVQSVHFPSALIEINSYAFTRCTSLKVISFPVDSKLIRIGQGAFSRTSIIIVKFPSSLQKIDEEAFSINHHLKSIAFPDNSKLDRIYSRVFASTGLTNVRFPSQLFDISDDAFENCIDLWKDIGIWLKNTKYKSNPQQFSSHNELLDINIPSNVSRIAPDIFNDYQFLSAIKFDENSILSEICDSAFCKSRIKKIDFPPSLQEIGKMAFYEASCLESISFPENSKLRIIKRLAFAETMIEKVEFPSSLEEIENEAFSKNNALKSITFEANSKLKRVFPKAFASTGIQKISFPPSLELISFDVFDKCLDLKSIEIPSCLEKIADSSFCDCQFLSTVTFTENSKLSVIEDNAFRDTSIRSIDFPSSLVKIGKKAFLDSFLTSITFPLNSKLYIINHSAFGSNPLKAVCFPPSLNKIGSNAFYKCYFLETINFLEDSKLVIIKKFAFSKTKIEKVQFPSSLVEIEREAFSENKNLTLVTFSEKSKLKYVGAKAFASTGIQDIKFPESLKEISSDALEDCTNKKLVIIPTTAMIMKTEKEIKSNDPNFKRFDKTFVIDRNLHSIEIQSNIEIIAGKHLKMKKD